MAITLPNKYGVLPVENPGVDSVTKANILNFQAIESITIGDASAASYTYTIGSLTAERQLVPNTLVKIAVTTNHFTVDAVLTLDANWRQAGDQIQLVFAPSDIPAGRTIFVKDQAASPNTLATITPASDGSRSTSSRKFVLNADGTWTKVADVPSTTGDITAGSLTLSSGAKVTKFLVGTKTYDAASITSPNTTSTTVTVTGAAAGDYAIATLSTSTTAVSITATVSSTDTVTVVVGAYSGTVDLTSGTLNVLVIKAA